MARTETSLDDLVEQQRQLVTQLREVDYWRRLVVARLDLAIAAVTDIDELSSRSERTAIPPFGLREIIGIPTPDEAAEDASTLVPLRDVLTELDRYRARLRQEVLVASRELTGRLGIGDHTTTDDDHTETEKSRSGEESCPTSQRSEAEGSLDGHTSDDVHGSARKPSTEVRNAG